MAEQSTSTSTALELQLCFALHDASRAITAAYRRGLAALGLTYSQYIVLLVLWDRGPVTMGHLCRVLHLDSGTLSPLLQRLEERGRIARHRRAEDERTVEVACTPAGEALQADALAVQAEVRAATGMDGEHLAELRGEVQRLADRLRTAGGPDVVTADVAPCPDPDAR